MALGLAPSYASLCFVQGLLVLAPGRPRRLTRSAFLGVVFPVAALVAGVVLVRTLAGGAHALATLAAVATPLLAACCGWLRRWPRPWLWVPAVALVYAVAWRASGTLLGEAAAVILIGLACLALAALVGGVASPLSIAAGLVLLVAVDVVLVWGTGEIGRTTTALHSVPPPRPPLLEHARPLPRLQDATFGDALMGWLDLLAPALLGLVAPPRRRLAAAAATTGAALAWGLLLFVTSPIPATVPVLAGLAAAGSLWLPRPGGEPGRGFRTTAGAGRLGSSAAPRRNHPN